MLLEIPDYKFWAHLLGCIINISLLRRKLSVASIKPHTAFVGAQREFIVLDQFEVVCEVIF